MNGVKNRGIGLARVKQKGGGIVPFLMTLWDRKGTWLFLSVGVVFFLNACTQKNASSPLRDKIEIENRLKAICTIDSIAQLQKEFQEEGNYLGSVVALREWGQRLSKNSKYDEALKVHSLGLKQAEKLGDTVECVMALNSMGTNYRRLGLLDAAQDYHYRAWKISEENTDTSFVAQKNRLVSLNGLGNIYMTIGNFARADSAFRKALAGEKDLGSDTGQAINYANLGAIFELQGELDSAWVYYRRSMEFNRKADNLVGISLCHNSFGSLLEKEHKYDKAIVEYEKAYSMLSSQDAWYALHSLTALARVYYSLGQTDKALVQLAKAKEIAQKVKSTEHLADVYNLYYEIYRDAKDYKQALDCYVKTIELQDSLVDMDKVNRIQNLSLSIERNRQEQRMIRSREELRSERVEKNTGFAIFALIVIFLLILVLLMYYIQHIRARNHQALKKMSSMREMFFTNVTHEFRTPLTVILGLSRDIMNKDVAISPETRDKVATIEQQGNSLLNLINQLLDISKIKSTVGDPDWRRGNIAVFLSMIVERYQDYARSKEIDLTFFSERDIDTDFIPDYISKAMNNLLSNAIKFTPQNGQIKVLVRQEKNQLHLTISDTGIGIPPENLSLIFEPFYQVETDFSRGGTGIGLALTKQAIEAMDGQIKVDSIFGKGTTFYIQIPIRHGNSPYARIEVQEIESTPILPKQEEELADRGSDGHNNPRLLIIEDNYEVARYIGSQFDERYDLFYASNGKRGVDKALELVPDLIITDLMMPEMSGLEVCRQVRGNEIVNHIPIIVVTAKNTEEDRLKALEVGADAYMIKPFDSKELCVRVDKLLEQRRLLRKKYSQAVAEGTEEVIALQSDVEQQFLRKIVDCISDSLNNGQNVDVAALTSHMCMSYSQLYRKLLAITGSTPQSYIQHFKIKRAQQLLKDQPELSLGEVADLCGFRDYSGFVRAFKSVCGVTPTQYTKGEN
ncbi:MAG: ATP-binding protein [Porphyromonas sp.]|nr:ATP-binding protein [Porphyromonas sp.]